MDIQKNLPLMSQNDELCSSLEEYNAYVMHIISQIIDFDIWFEQSKGRDFPKEWYDIIKVSKQSCMDK